MTEIPAGWYPDPSAEPDDPPQDRWWDGSAWSWHVQPAAVDPGALGPGGPGMPATGADYSLAASSAPGAAGAVGWTSAPQLSYLVGPTTPDGAPLASWWPRVGAYLIDALITGSVQGLVSAPILWPVLLSYVDYVKAAADAAEQGTPPPVITDFVQTAFPRMALIAVISLTIAAIYHGFFLRRQGATPGKMALGLQVRLRDAPGPLSWATIAKRILGQFGIGLVSVIPVVGGVGSLYRLLDALWPLWDDKNQALHDKIAATNVVRTR